MLQGDSAYQGKVSDAGYYTAGISMIGNSKTRVVNYLLKVKANSMGGSLYI